MSLIVVHYAHDLFMYITFMHVYSRIVVQISNSAEGYGDGEEGEGEQENEAAAKKRKPWGDTLHFCPVALKEQGVLWPGNEECALRYAHVQYWSRKKKSSH